MAPVQDGKVYLTTESILNHQSTPWAFGIILDIDAKLQA